ncbi:dienelactone hydrolase family protein [Actinoplanes sp. URMC 104]|uniref:dienelactone hydrolase family protein n=1 Tax=Actinoplanes sp. URMC 104 TaxID=3423409 RepID=UPI003F19D2BB
MTSSVSGPSPAPAGILVIHGGAGLDDHARAQAARWATRYMPATCTAPGVAGDRERVMAKVAALRDDPARLNRRASAGLDVLRSHAGPDAPVAAVGYCFGGLAALTMARQAAPIVAAVSIHGGLATVSPATPGSVSARLLVCHGAADPHVPFAQVEGFSDEMEAAGADWQLIMYGGAQHGFTHTHARPGETPGVAYDEVADTRSFAAAADFLATAFTDAAADAQ